MTKLLYLKDPYVKEFKAKVNKIENKLIYLDQTAFYPESGGQPNDLGKLVKDNKEFKIISVKKLNNEIAHELNEAWLKIGDNIIGIIDWNRRYTLMKSHTASHVLAGLINKKFKALVTGKQLGTEKSRIDFSLEEFDRQKISSLVEEANNLIKKGVEVKSYFLAREEAMKIPDIVKLAERLPPAIPELRIVEIKGIDTQACGGTHLKNISEIKEIILLDLENRGKSNRRIYFKIR